MHTSQKNALAQRLGRAALAITRVAAESDLDAERKEELFALAEESLLLSYRFLEAQGKRGLFQVAIDVLMRAGQALGCESDEI